jgi:carboxyl-terminal processing protease
MRPRYTGGVHVISLPSPGCRCPSKFSLQGIALLLVVASLASCDLRTLPSAIENVDESAFQVALAPSRSGGTLTLRIPVPEDDDRFEESFLRPEPPPGYTAGSWRQELSLVPSPLWTTSQEYWLGWFFLDLLAIHRDSLPDPRAWRSSGLESLYTAATKGRDPFTRYVPPDEGDRTGSLLAGSNTINGFGFMLRQGMGDSIVVGYTLPNGPAHQAGLRRDDRILAVDDRSWADFKATLDASKEVTANFRIRRPSAGAVLSLGIRSAPLVYPSVWTDTLQGGVGYISISSFLSGQGQSTDDLFAEALREMETIRRIQTGWILDLRQNGGGTIQSSLGVAGSLLGPGTVLVRIRERVSRSRSSYQMKTVDSLLASPKEFLQNLPRGRIAFLQDRGTASASEIVLSALRENLDTTRLRTYGEKSYGKGIGQTYIPTPLGGFYAITLMTIDPLLAPRYHGVGILPDVPTDRGEILSRALSDILAPSVAARGAGIASLEGVDDVDAWNLRERSGGPKVPLRSGVGPGRDIW